LLDSGPVLLEFIEAFAGISGFQGGATQDSGRACRVITDHNDVGFAVITGHVPKGVAVGVEALEVGLYHGATILSTCL
jgi:hypothetical protein